MSQTQVGRRYPTDLNDTEWLLIEAMEKAMKEPKYAIGQTDLPFEDSLTGML